ncbi:MAG TPA: cupin domain-containing protein [Nitrososphaerales archaeon]|nr:cupin domain-containing protein [Nitrososphaerales archaeon]
MENKAQFIPESEVTTTHRPYPGNQTFLPISEPISLLSLIGFENESIVSRTLVNHNLGTITLFAFDLGQGLSEHTSPFDAFVHVLEGRVEITVSEKHIQAGEGEIVILPANQPHALKALSKFKMLLTMMRS